MLLSDGAVMEGADPLDAAARARRLGIPIHTVALGTADGVVDERSGQAIPVPPGPAALRAIAAARSAPPFAGGGLLGGVRRRGRLP